MTKVEPLLRTFGEARQALLDEGVIRTRHVVGSLGEQYAAEALHLRLAEDPTHAGYDAEWSDGATYEIKTRRVYQSERRSLGSRHGTPSRIASSGHR